MLWQSVSFSFWAILNSKSNYGHVKLLSARSQVYSAYVKVKALWEAKSGNCVLAIRMDGAKEFCKGKLGDHLTSRGIVMQVTAPYAHSQNGKTKHFVRTIEDGFQTLLPDSRLPMSFWGDAALTISYLCNWAPTMALPTNTTAYEIMHKAKPNLTHLHIWGCQCFVAIPPKLCTKGGPQHFEAIFVGYEDDCVGWHVHDLNGKYHFSRDVISNELMPGCLSHTISPLFSSAPHSPSSPTSSSSSPSTSTPPPPTPCPIRNAHHTIKGQAFVETIRLCDACLATKPEMHLIHNNF